MAVDYFGLIERDWEEIDTEVCKFSICDRKGVCKIFKKEKKKLAICEDCFIEDTNRFYSLEHKHLNNSSNVPNSLK
jgi:hypothetical protein